LTLRMKNSLSRSAFADLLRLSPFSCALTGAFLAAARQLLRSMCVGDGLNEIVGQKERTSPFSQWTLCDKITAIRNRF